MNNLRVSLLSVLSLTLMLTSCDDGNNILETGVCNFDTLTADSTETYSFESNFSDYFIQSPRWESFDANITLVAEKGQLTANSGNTSSALEAWKLFKLQMPYNKSWEISVDANVPLHWNSNGGNQAQVGVGIFVGKPVASGQSSKVYECNLAAINGGERFVQAQLIANRLGADPIDVQRTVLNQSTEFGTLKIQFCATDKTLGFYIDNNKVGSSVRAINSEGLDDWGLTEVDVMDVGIMGFAENTTITSKQPTLDNFNYKIY